MFNFFKKIKARLQTWREFGGFRSIFTNFGADMYASAIVRSCIRVLAEYSSKADPATSKTKLTQILKYSPNIFMSGSDFLYKIREAGITVPVLPGIMPITNAAQVEKAIRLSGSFIPQRFKALVDEFGRNPAAMKQAGIAYATDQIIDLFANDIRTVHVYSMNKPDVAAGIHANVSAVLGLPV